ncbi:hypothetical protein BJX61DRAFT_62217 [Aspergillus egyptiacus]|nr:hypothetical protein BJX61DRAFT_62217 [Aspergillus egyptiacus]
MSQEFYVRIAVWFSSSHRSVLVLSWSVAGGSRSFHKHNRSVCVAAWYSLDQGFGCLSFSIGAERILSLITPYDLNEESGKSPDMAGLFGTPAPLSVLPSCRRIERHEVVTRNASQDSFLADWLFFPGSMDHLEIRVLSYESSASPGILPTLSEMYHSVACVDALNNVNP